MLYLNAKPNSTHVNLARLEKEGKLKAVITQNIDGLHQAAGSKNVMELHGSVHKNFCMNCKKTYDVNLIATANYPALQLRRYYKADVVLYEESLKDDI
jgi:NAD-dependent deacetylase